MKKSLSLSLLASAAFIGGGHNLEAEEVEVTLPRGAYFTMEVEESDTFFEVANKALSFMEEDEAEWGELFFAVNIPNKRPSAFDSALRSSSELHIVTAISQDIMRNFAEILSEDEKSDIRFIVTNLANKSLPRIFMMRGKLEAAGDRIDRVHPLRFLEYVFSDEELKSGVHNIRSKGKVWRDFFGGLRDSLQFESERFNIKEDYVKEFASSVKIDTALILPSIRETRWTDFMEILLNQIPRSQNHHRYDN